MGFPSPGVFSFALENGMKLKSAFHMGRARHLQPRLPQGRRHATTSRTLEGKTILLGSAAWQSIVDPMLAVQGVDITKVKYVEAGWPTWGTALAAGQGDAALAWEGLRAEWISTGPRLRILARRAALAAVCQHLRGARGRPRGSGQEGLPRQVPARPGRWASKLRYHNPMAAVHAVFEQFPSVAQTNGPELGAMSLLQNLNVVRGDMSKRKGWGDHDMAAWQTFFDKVARARPDQDPDQGRGRLHQRLHRCGQRLRPREGQGRRARRRAAGRPGRRRRRGGQGHAVRPGHRLIRDDAGAATCRPPPADNCMGRAGWPTR